MTDTNMDTATRMIVNRRYLAISGITRDVGGIKSIKTRKKIVNVTKILMANVILWPLNGM